jgi:hypothetical protein
MAMRSSSDCKHRVSTSRASCDLAWNISRISAASFGRPPGMPKLRDRFLDRDA